jgi:hypothetical protein
MLKDVDGFEKDDLLNYGEVLFCGQTTHLISKARRFL